MKTAVDSNIISSIWSGAPTAVKASERLNAAMHEGALLISPFVFAELLAYPGATAASVREFCDDTGIAIDEKIQGQVWVETGQRFARYANRRRRSFGAAPRRLLADFLIGAHAMVQADRLFTFDPKVYAQDFPELKLY
ncbi:MAG TPA: type II toxin-antitoxin system VapC family toxin [Terracidiphilus sp.]|nr:type II toxin-antitoxin system VapC family toxin [Terracidiphilus sp.]